MQGGLALQIRWLPWLSRKPLSFVCAKIVTISTIKINYAMWHDIEKNDQGPLNVHQTPHLYFLNNAFMN
jgi:hypothetical protein